MRTLKELAQQFHFRLQTVKRDTALEPNLAWYPWSSLGQIEFLDNMLGSDPAALLRMIGSDPVLDIGCGDGDIAFFLESLGARVNVVDHPPTNYNAMYGVRHLQQRLASTVGVYQLDVDASTQLPGGPYGLTICLGILYHLKNPFLVLETLARHSRHVFLSTRIAEWAPDKTTSFGGNPVAYLVGADELNQDDTNYWIFTEAGLRRILTRAGWDIVQYTAAGAVSSSDPVSPQGDARAYILARSRFAAAFCDFRRTSGWHEIEHKTGQWSTGQFTVETTLPEPRAPGRLRFHFFLPEAVLTPATAISLSAQLTIGQASLALPMQTYTTAGEHEYSVETPDLSAGVLRIEFTLSSAIPPSSADQRELGLQVRTNGAPPVTLY